MKNLFNSIKVLRPNKNVFDLTHDVKLSLDMGDLVPILAMECVPGDKFKLSCESLLRFAPLTSPVMHRFDVTMHYFFVPNRILWPNWEAWITSPAPTAVHPYVDADDGTAPQNKLHDYLGVHTGSLPGPRNVNAFPYAAYNCIYNEYYRDQNLVAEVPYELVDGDNTSNEEVWAVIRKRAWEHDYFTAALPFAQKGAAVAIPLGTVELSPTSTNPGLFVEAATHANISGATSPTGITANLEVDGEPAQYDPNGTLEVAPTTVGDLRRSIKLQEFLERLARGGSRLTEVIWNFFGVKSSDARLQRPEYITGTKSPVVISEVLNSTGEDGGLPQGNMSGHAVSVTTGKYGSYYCEEHGWIMGIMSVMPKTAYQQGIPKAFLKINDPFEYFWPQFAHIGEQAVQQQELYAASATPEATFGYVPRYSEYKYMPSRVCGDFKDTLDHWHMGRIFASDPALNQAFIECAPGKRIFAVEDASPHSLYCHVLNKITAVRPMPKFGTPMF